MIYILKDIGAGTIGVGGDKTIAPENVVPLSDSDVTTQDIIDAGGITEETDPIFVASEAYNITATNKTNWTEAYNKGVTAVSVTGDENKILTLTFRDSSTLTASFTDMAGGVADGDEYVNSLNFDSTNGVLTVGRTGELTDITVSLDGRYLTSLPAHTHAWAEITGKPNLVNSVTGTTVDNTDPLNPIINRDRFGIVNEDNINDNNQSRVFNAQGYDFEIQNVNSVDFWNEFDGGKYVNFYMTSLGHNLYYDNYVNNTSSSVKVTEYGASMNYSGYQFIVDSTGIRYFDEASSSIIQFPMGREGTVALVEDLVGGGGGVESVTGTGVDNTDPLNPIVKFNSLQEIYDSAAGLNNYANDLYITSGNSSLDIYLDSNYGGTFETIFENGGYFGVQGQGSFLSMNVDNSSPSFQWYGYGSSGDEDTLIDARSGQIELQATSYNYQSTGERVSVDVYLEDGVFLVDTIRVSSANTFSLKTPTPTAITGISNLTFPFKTGDYTLPITVNGIAADSTGNIVVPTDGGGGGGVQSVTGTAVDNTDPLNPIVNLPSSSLSRFGVSGEDDTAAENRTFNLGTQTLRIDSTNATYDTYSSFKNSNYDLQVSNVSTDVHSYFNMWEGGIGLEVWEADNSNHGIFFESTGITFKNKYQTLQLPNNKGGYIPLTVNGIAADSTGNIVVPSGGITEETDPIFVASEAYGITATDKTNWTDAYNKKVVGATVTGDANKTLTLTFQDSTTITASFVDQAGVADGDEYVNSLNFNTADGVLTVGRTGELTDITVSLDGRYLTSLPAHGHVWSEITGKPTTIAGYGITDAYTSWNLKTNGVQRTTVQNGGTLDIVGTGAATVTYGAGGVVNINVPVVDGNGGTVSNILELINVLDNGVAQDGTDQTANIQSLISSNSILYFPSGNYTVNTAILLPQLTNLTILGDKGTTFTTSGRNIFNTTGDLNNIKFENIRFISTSTVTTDDYENSLFHCDGHDLNRITFEECYFSAPLAQTNGIKMTNEGNKRTTKIRVLRCEFDILGRMGMELQNHVYDGVSRYEDVWVDQCIFNRVGEIMYGMGVSFSGQGSNVKVTNCLFRENGNGGLSGSAIEYVGCSNSIIDNNTFDGNYKSLLVGGTSYITSKDITISNSITIREDIEGNAFQYLDGLKSMNNAFKRFTNLHHLTNASFNGDTFSANTYTVFDVEEINNIQFYNCTIEQSENYLSIFYIRGVVENIKLNNTQMYLASDVNIIEYHPGVSTDPPSYNNVFLYDYATRKLNETLGGSVLGQNGITGLWKGTQAQYDAITPDPNVIYYII